MKKRLGCGFLACPPSSSSIALKEVPPRNWIFCLHLTSMIFRLVARPPIHVPSALSFIFGAIIGVMGICGVSRHFLVPVRRKRQNGRPLLTKPSVVLADRRWEPYGFHLVPLSSPHPQPHFLNSSGDMAMMCQS
ncbi:hypothetical protein AMTR_s00155p00031060 [Amborella trichopoda]|uniref:Transmembrane protein n=1 Tax=Amborella trichopoda TaxID=13333 RepID=W1PI45_AMBTC|nr:hypothetical protein AMTR_s00155p00031060 [Amborella trichopoda]